MFNQARRTSEKETRSTSRIKKPMDKEITLKNANGNWQTLTTLKWEQRKPYTPNNEKEIKSEIPGKIVRMFEASKAGHTVKKGTPLLEIEAMKMVNTIASPIDGKIQKVSVREGEEVGKSELLISFE